ncbi:MAG TPA: histidinol-phosphate transaminase [Dongiaceae bacterium]|nr:histidinol-phosphate transaminase [Dongiaceae bacterium]
MSRFFDLVTKPARDMGIPQPAPAMPKPIPQPALIKLDSNENPLGPSPRAVEAMRRAISNVHTYPDNDCAELRARLAAHHDVPMEQILASAGSTGIISLLCQTLLAPGLNAVTSEKSFVVYGMAVRSIGAELLEAPMRDDAFDLAAILQAINEHTRLIFLANPNNPTGTIVDADQVERFLEEIPGHVVVVLDEAYYDFANYFAHRRGANYSRSLDWVRKGRGLVVLRTFSKAHGLAGLRIGYGIGPSELLSYCARMQSTFTVSSIALEAALASVDDQNHIKRTVANNAEQAQVLGVGLSELGFRVVPTWTNFLYCDLAADATAVAQQLRQEGVSIRPLGAWGAPNCIRVSIGTPQQNERFLETIRRISQSLHRRG